MTAEIETHITIYKNVMFVLMRLHKEAREPNISDNEYANRAFAITKLLNRFEDDFGTEAMITIIQKTSEMLGETLGPLDSTIVKKLIAKGWEVTKISKVLEYTKLKPNKDQQH